MADSCNLCSPGYDMMEVLDENGEVLFEYYEQSGDYVSFFECVEGDGDFEGNFCPWGCEGLCVYSNYE